MTSTTQVALGGHLRQADIVENEFRHALTKNCAIIGRFLPLRHQAQSKKSTGNQELGLTVEFQSEIQNRKRI